MEQETDTGLSSRPTGQVNLGIIEDKIVLGINGKPILGMTPHQAALMAAELIKYATTLSVGAKVVEKAIHDVASEPEKSSDN